MDGLTVSLIIIAYRLLVPLTIFRWPLAGIFIAMIADATDAMLLDAVGGWGLFTGSQRYSFWDKGLDVWYLLLAWMATRKFWTEPLARRTASVLFLWRVAGTAVFFVFPARWVFVLAPSIFENFYIVWTAIRKWWPSFALNGRRLTVILLAAGIPKVLQEYLMHYRYVNQTWFFFKTHVFWWLY